MYRATFVILLVLAGIFVTGDGVQAQGWGRVSGTVRDGESGIHLPGVTVVVSGTNFGTASNADGFYSLRVPQGRYLLSFSFIGYTSLSDSVYVLAGDIASVDVSLRPLRLELETITVEAPSRSKAAGVYEIDPEDVQRIPAPFRDGFRLLKLQPGVATNNELSSDYSVRGGGFNENLVYINGFEVYRPFRVRQGEQEGLGIINPDLTRRMTLYTGGFPVRYGGKLSSALDVDYFEPRLMSRSASAYASLLDAGAMLAGASKDRRAGIGLSFRTVRARRFFQTQEMKGFYDPRYSDIQGAAQFAWAEGQDISVVGSYAHHRFRLEPTTRKTFFGTFNNLQSLWTDYTGEEIDGYETAFLGVRLGMNLGNKARAEHRYAYFETDEREDFQISGEAVLYVIENPFESDPGTGQGLIPTGFSRQEDSADNRVRVRTHTVRGRYSVPLGQHILEAGWSARAMNFDDTIAEKSIVTGTSEEGTAVRLVADSLSDAAEVTGQQFGAYVQDEIHLLPETSRLVVTGGLRFDHFSFNKESTLSPRLSARLQLTPRTFAFSSWGIFYQAPTYRELRGAPEPGAGILGALNRNLKAQRSIHYVAGIEHFVPSRRLTVRAEAYVKTLTRLISYEVQNVRIAYSGQNDSKGYAAGLDVQFRGELVPGLESWLNYGFLVTRERFLDEYLTPYNRGSLPRPTDQRHTFSIVVQDYVPRDPTWKISLRFLFGSGLPYTPPAPGPTVGTVQIQVPGPRSSARYPAYKRVDLGATKRIEIFQSESGERTIGLSLTGEVLNVFDMTNTVAYTWVIGAGGRWSRIPTRLTPRTFNLRARLDF
jgi:outer membrane receptor for ferrienterochelin and colicin